MKATFLVSALSFFLLSSSLALSQYPPVTDVEGHDLQANTNYYIFPVTPITGGGLTVKMRNRRCPSYVVQESVQDSNGLPIRFLPVNPNDKIISLSSDMNIAFHAETICVQSMGWMLEGIKQITEQRYVTTGGLIGHPGINTLSNWFKIQSAGKDYKIVYCPSVCSSCKVICGNVSVIYEDGNRWLGLSEEPLVVKFKKV